MSKGKEAPVVPVLGGRTLNQTDPERILNIV